MMAFVGADGCKAGWLAVGITERDGWSVDVFPSAVSLWERHREASLILIDIPIGLREKGPQERLCDTMARNLLGPRASSVFPAPCRGALSAGSYQEASRRNLELTGTRKLSRQSWAIASKIRQVDELLAHDDVARRKIREVHPEVLFWGLAGRPMAHPKRSGEGFRERKRVLQSVCAQADDIVTGALTRNYKGVAGDDILDALSAAVTARLGREGLRSIPEQPERDARGLPMEIVYYPRHPQRTPL
jgi:predicted RNase H-like nuclease